MARRPLSFPKRPVWCNNTVGSSIEFWYSEALPTDGVVNIRPWIDLSSITDTSQLRARVVIATSDDGVDFGSATAVDSSEASTAGVTVRNGYTSIAATVQGKLYWRIGLEVYNSSSTSALNLAYAAMGADFQD